MRFTPFMTNFATYTLLPKVCGQPINCIHLCLLKKLPSRFSLLFAFMITSTLLGRLFNRFWNVNVGICALSGTRELMSSDTGAWGAECSINPRVFTGIDFKATLEFFHAPL